MNGCVIPHTPIAVDFWKIRECPQTRIFLLTHLHGDHITGLTSSWNYPIYCSEITGKLLEHKHGIKKELIHTLQIGCAEIIYLDLEHSEQMSLTAIDANHCPGAVMFLMEGYFGTVLHTGDFRFTPEMIETKPLADYAGKIDQLFLDNTYCSPSCRFPSRESATETIIDIIESHPSDMIVLGLRNLGKESLLYKIAEKFQEYISVPSHMFETLEILEAPDVFMMGYSECRISVVPFHKISSKWVAGVNGIKPTIVILPTALYCGIDAVPYENQENVFVVPYSDHSSYNELEKFVSFIRPGKIIPVVKAKSRGVFGMSVADRADMSVFKKYTHGGWNIKFDIPKSVKRYMTDGGSRPLLNKVVRKRKVGQTNIAQALKRVKRGIIFNSPSNSPSGEILTCKERQRGIEGRKKENGKQPGSKRRLFDIQKCSPNSQQAQLLPCLRSEDTHSERNKFDRCDTSQKKTKDNNTTGLHVTTGILGYLNRNIPAKKTQCGTAIRSKEKEKQTKTKGRLSAIQNYLPMSPKPKGTQLLSCPRAKCTHSERNKLKKRTFQEKNMDGSAGLHVTAKTIVKISANEKVQNWLHTLDSDYSNLSVSSEQLTEWNNRPESELRESGHNERKEREDNQKEKDCVEDAISEGFEIQESQGFNIIKEVEINNCLNTNTSCSDKEDTTTQPKECLEEHGSLGFHSEAANTCIWQEPAVSKTGKEANKNEHHEDDTMNNSTCVSKHGLECTSKYIVGSAINGTEKNLPLTEKFDGILDCRTYSVKSRNSTSKPKANVSGEMSKYQKDENTNIDSNDQNGDYENLPTMRSEVSQRTLVNADKAVLKTDAGIIEISDTTCEFEDYEESPQSQSEIRCTAFSRNIDNEKHFEDRNFKDSHACEQYKEKLTKNQSKQQISLSTAKPAANCSYQQGKLSKYFQRGSKHIGKAVDNSKVSLYLKKLKQIATIARNNSQSSEGKDSEPDCVREDNGTDCVREDSDTDCVRILDIAELDFSEDRQSDTDCLTEESETDCGRVLEIAERENTIQKIETVTDKRSKIDNETNEIDVNLPDVELRPSDCRTNAERNSTETICTVENRQHISDNSTDNEKMVVPAWKEYIDKLEKAVQKHNGRRISLSTSWTEHFANGHCQAERNGNNSTLNKFSVKCRQNSSRGYLYALFRKKDL